MQSCEHADRSAIAYCLTERIERVPSCSGNMMRRCAGALLRHTKIGRDVSGWDTSNVVDMGFMFERCSSLGFLKTGTAWSTSVPGGNPRFPRTMYDESGNMFEEWDTIPDGAHTYTAVIPLALTTGGSGA